MCSLGTGVHQFWPGFSPAAAGQSHISMLPVVALLFFFFNKLPLLGRAQFIPHWLDNHVKVCLPLGLSFIAGELAFISLSSLSLPLRSPSRPPVPPERIRPQHGVVSPGKGPFGVFHRGHGHGVPRGGRAQAGPHHRLPLHRRLVAPILPPHPTSLSLAGTKYTRPILHPYPRLPSRPLFGASLPHPRLLCHFVLSCPRFASSSCYFIMAFHQTLYSRHFFCTITLIFIHAHLFFFFFLLPLHLSLSFSRCIACFLSNPPLALQPFHSAFFIPYALHCHTPPDYLQLFPHRFPPHCDPAGAKRLLTLKLF